MSAILEAELVATRLEFPEGPALLADGRLAFVEEAAGCVSVLEGGSVRKLAVLGGNPNGLAVRDDGSILVTRGPGMPGRMSATPAIVSVEPESGRFEELVTEVDGQRLRSPNDLCIGPTGDLFFTDPGQFDRDTGMPGWICRVSSGVATIAVHLPNVYPNGIAFSDAGILTWVESITGNVIILRDGVPQVSASLGPDAIPDGCAYTDDGRLVIAAFDQGGLALIDWRGGVPTVEMLTWAADVRATNVAFDGSTLWVTDAGPRSDTSMTSGRLWRLTTSLQGRKLNG